MAQRGRPPYPDTLTPRQQEVLALVRQGLTNPEIGERLGISRDGAKFHVSEIITRIGVTTRHEAAEWDGTTPEARLRVLSDGGWQAWKPAAAAEGTSTMPTQRLEAA